ncbi:MAG: 6-carboxytetrahydropterin synthase [Ignavibacteria bacterium]|nr:6-carboxytetrahydropterin synthase [Ignavibacteria bacterium]
MPSGNPTVYITRKGHFSASHRLFNRQWSNDRNQEVFGKCNNPNGHGHNYEVEVTVAGSIGPDTGMVMDLKKLADLLDEEVLERFDHKHLNHDVEALKGVIPTAENIAIVIWKILSDRIPDGRLFSVKLYESGNNFVEYRGDRTA